MMHLDRFIVATVLLHSFLQFFQPDKRTVGLCIEKELHMLNKLLDSPAKPFVMIVGGGKVDKLPLLHYMLDKVQTILKCVQHLSLPF